MSQRKPKLTKITISLLKDGVDRDTALRDGKDTEGHVVPAIDADQESLFVSSKQPHAPKWVSYLSEHVTGGLSGLMSASASAVLFIEARGHLFAATWGQGRHLVDPDCVVQDFGLRVVLNSVAPDQLKSVDAKTIEETTLHTRRDLSQDSSFSAFGLDVSRDLLRAVTGTPSDPEFAHRLTGADALGISTRTELPDLGDLVARIYDAYKSEVYKKHFDFIDFLRPVKRASQIKTLDAKLVDALRNKAIDDLHLAAPQTLDWLEVDGFKFHRDDAEREMNDPKISEYLDFREPGEIDVELLKSDRLLALGSDGSQVQGSWPVYRCLVYQVENDGQLFVLSTGDWFSVDLSYRDQVEAEVEALPDFEGLPDADQGTDEDAYNLKASEALEALCLDKKLVYDGGPDRMEICDIFTRDGGFIHVKQRGSSSTLSHLFTQGVNSAHRLLLDDEFRSKAREVIRRENPLFEDLFPAENPVAGDHEITYAVITRSNRETPLTLPFFSVVSLRAAASQLKAYGFTVSKASVREV